MSLSKKQNKRKQQGFYFTDVYFLGKLLWTQHISNISLLFTREMQYTNHSFIHIYSANLTKIYNNQSIAQKSSQSFSYTLMICKFKQSTRASVCFDSWKIFKLEKNRLIFNFIYFYILSECPMSGRIKSDVLYHEKPFNQGLL